MHPEGTCHLLIFIAIRLLVLESVHGNTIGRQCPQYGERGHSAAGSTQMTMKS